MALAQVIRFDERQAIGRAQRAPEKASMGVILHLQRSPALSPEAEARITADEDRIAGRGRDPG